MNVSMCSYKIVNDSSTGIFRIFQEKMSLLVTWACALILAVIGLAVPKVHAQDGAIIDEIIVTARKREERLQEVPLSVSAFTASDLEARSASSLSDLDNLTPNFSFMNAREGSSIRIRGVGQSDPSLFFDPGVGIYVDGVYIARMRGVDLDLMGVERVEVLRGPQGTLFGKNTVGGAVNLISARPTDEFSGSAELTIGRYDRIDGKASINLPLAPGVLAARVSAVTRNRDGYGQRIDFDTGQVSGEMGDEDSFSGRVAINWTPREDIGILINVDGTRAREAGLAKSLLAAAVTPPIAGINFFVDPDYGPQMLTDNKYQSFADGSDISDVDSWGVAVNADWKAGDLSLRSITSYRDHETVYGIDPDGSPTIILDQVVPEESQTFSQEFQVSGLSFADRLNWIAGVYYFEEDSQMAAETLLFQELYTFTGFDASLLLDVWSDVQSWAVFSQGTYTSTDKLSVTAGLRYTVDDKEVARERHSVNTGALTVPRETLADSWDAVTGRVGFEYRWTDDVMAYFSVARGFKSGGINGASFLPGEHLAFDPEEIWTYEVGLRSDWLDQRLRFNVSAFFSDYTDLQFRVARASPTGQPIAIVENAAKAEVKGFELEISALPAPGLEFSAGVGYQDAEYTEIDPANTIVTLNDEFPDTPEWSLMLAGQYTMPLQNLGELISRIDYSYKTETQNAVTNSPFLVQDDYGLVNARLTFRTDSGRWEVAAFVTNLTDEAVMIIGADFLTGLGLVEAQYAPLRQWGASFKYNF